MFISWQFFLTVMKILLGIWPVYEFTAGLTFVIISILQAYLGSKDSSEIGPYNDTYDFSSNSVLTSPYQARLVINSIGIVGSVMITLIQI